MAKAKRHRDTELDRLRREPQAAERLEVEDQKIPAPSSPGPFPAGSNAVELFRERWRQLLAMPERFRNDIQTPEQSVLEFTSPSAHSTNKTQPSTSSTPAYNADGLGSIATFDPSYLGPSGQQTTQNLPNYTSPDFQSGITTNTPGDFTMRQTTGSSYNAIPAATTTWSMGPGFVPWLWPETDPSVDVFSNVDLDALDVNMDLDVEMDLYNWIESAKGMEWDAGSSGNWPA